MDKQIKLHIACGTVYLEGYENIDVVGHLASDRPDLVEQNITTFSNYYKNEVTKHDFMSGKYQQREIVVDRLLDIRDLDQVYKNVDEILGVHIFEHFTYAEGSDFLQSWFRTLRSGGVLKLYMPDVVGIIDNYLKDKDTAWMLRQLYGSQKNEYGIHKSGYVFSILADLMRSVGYINIQELESINNYPAFGIQGEKP